MSEVWNEFKTLKEEKGKGKYLSTHWAPVERRLWCQRNNSKREYRIMI